MEEGKTKMDWRNYDPYEHAECLLEYDGNCEAPDGSVCEKCFVKPHVVLCKPHIALKIAEEFIKGNKVKSIW